MAELKPCIPYNNFKASTNGIDLSHDSHLQGYQQLEFFMLSTWPLDTYQTWMLFQITWFVWIDKELFFPRHFPIINIFYNFLQNDIVKN